MKSITEFINESYPISGSSVEDGFEKYSERAEEVGRGNRENATLWEKGDIVYDGVNFHRVKHISGYLVTLEQLKRKLVSGDGVNHSVNVPDLDADPTETDTKRINPRTKRIKAGYDRYFELWDGKRKGNSFW